MDRLHFVCWEMWMQWKFPSGSAIWGQWRLNPPGIFHPDKNHNFILLHRCFCHNSLLSVLILCRKQKALSVNFCEMHNQIQFQETIQTGIKRAWTTGVNAISLEKPACKTFLPCTEHRMNDMKWIKMRRLRFVVSFSAYISCLLFFFSLAQVMSVSFYLRMVPNYKNETSQRILANCVSIWLIQWTVFFCVFKLFMVDL